MQPTQNTLRLLFSTLSFLCGLCAAAQTGTAVAANDCKNLKPPINRLLAHENIDKAQRAALRADGKADAVFYNGDNEDINFFVTQALTQKVDWLQCRIERDSAIGHRKKVAYLIGTEKLLKHFTNGLRSRRFNPSNFPGILQAYEEAIDRDKKGESIERIAERSNYEVANGLIVSGAFEENPGYKEARHAALRKYVTLYPDRTFAALNQNPDVPFRDSLIVAAGYKYPHKLYDYAAAANKLGYAIRSVNDPLIRTVVRMASSGSGQLYFPFLDNILKGRQTLEEIDAVKNDEVKYYKLLVKTRMDYVQRQMQKDTVREMNRLMWWLEKKAREVFIKTINGLHNESDPVRFRILQQLTPQELYYVAVSGESEIYTSSYVRGVYPIMMQKIGNRGDSLLLSVGFDRFKKFIRLAAGFNTLSHFLGSFKDKEDARSLMTAFVNGLEKSEGLEDGVDVADSYVSIVESDKELANYILALTKRNYERNVANNNQRGAVIYDLLYKLFLSADSTQGIDLSKEFGIPPVYTVSYGTLAADSQQRVVMQVFFYGDQDGQNIFQGFLRHFSNGNWKITPGKQWYSIASTKGKPILIFANRPLPEESGEDEKAQEALTAYLTENGMEPTIVVHRGHSYYANSTIEHITSAAKIVFLGSCGGYHLIHDVLRHAPDAHIIASKQIGKTVINQPFFNVLMEKLRNGQNIEWIPFWREFQRSAGSVEGFEDYIPPHKNLGAIFIKAYKNKMGEEEED